MKNDKAVSFIALCFMTAIALFTSDIYLSSFPIIADNLKIGQNLVKLTLSFYLLGLCSCQIIVGYLIGVINKYRLSVIACCIFIVSSFLIVFSYNIYMIYFLRFFQAFSAGILTSTSRIIISEKSIQNKELSGFFAKVYLSLGIAPLISPLLGSAISAYMGWRYIFLFLSIFGTIMLYFVFYLKKSENTPKAIQKIPSDKMLAMYSVLLGRAAFLRSALIVGSSFVIYFTFLCQAPFILNSVGLSVGDIGLLFVPISITYIAASLWHTRLVKVIGVDKLIKFGLIIFFVGSSSMVAVSLSISQAYWMLIPMCIMTFSNGFLVPAATFSAMRSAMNMPAAASSLLGFLQLIPPILGTILLSALKIDTIFGVSLITFLLPLVLLALPIIINKFKLTEIVHEG